ncbi:MAG: hypothetical protein AABY83_02675 [Pseudomonadota bacterium]
MYMHKRMLVVLPLLLLSGVAMAFDRDDAVRKATTALREMVNDHDISVVSAAAQQWRDSSLGCPQAGMMYAQVITTGYRVILKSKDKKYDWRVSEYSARLCESNAKKAPHNPAKRAID